MLVAAFFLREKEAVRPQQKVCAYGHALPDAQPCPAYAKITNASGRAIMNPRLVYLHKAARQDGCTAVPSSSPSDMHASGLRGHEPPLNACPLWRLPRRRAA